MRARDVHVHLAKVRVGAVGAMRAGGSDGPGLGLCPHLLGGWLCPPHLLCTQSSTTPHQTVPTNPAWGAGRPLGPRGGLERRLDVRLRQPAQLQGRVPHVRPPRALQVRAWLGRPWCRDVSQQAASPLCPKRQAQASSCSVTRPKLEPPPSPLPAPNTAREWLRGTCKSCRYPHPPFDLPERKGGGEQVVSRTTPAWRPPGGAAARPAAARPAAAGRRPAGRPQSQLLDAAGPAALAAVAANLGMPGTSRAELEAMLGADGLADALENVMDAAAEQLLTPPQQPAPASGPAASPEAAPRSSSALSADSGSRSAPDGPLRLLDSSGLWACGCGRRNPPSGSNRCKRCKQLAPCRRAALLRCCLLTFRLHCSRPGPWRARTRLNHPPCLFAPALPAQEVDAGRVRRWASLRVPAPTL